MISSSAYCASEWDKTKPVSTDYKINYPSDAQENNEAIDRLVSQYPKGITLSYSSATTIIASTGGIVCSNSAGTVRYFRNNTATTSITFTDIDAGAEVGSTTYYIYANCDADAATATFKVSLSSSAPTGVTYYKRIGSFYNDSSSNVTLLQNDNPAFPEFGTISSGKTSGTVYQALSDGFVSVRAASATNTCSVNFYAGYANPPTVIRQMSQIIGGGVGVHCSFTSYVLAGEYYKSSTDNTMSNYDFIPLN